MAAWDSIDYSVHYLLATATGIDATAAIDLDGINVAGFWQPIVTVIATGIAGGGNHDIELNTGNDGMNFHLVDTGAATITSSNASTIISPNAAARINGLYVSVSSTYTITISAGTIDVELFMLRV